MNVKTLPAKCNDFHGHRAHGTCSRFRPESRVLRNWLWNDVAKCVGWLSAPKHTCNRSKKSFDFFAWRLWFDRTSLGSRCGHDANRGYCQFDSNWNVAC